MADIQISDVTTGSITGTGAFDKLMSSVQEHLDDQFESGRIKGTDYANVYLGSMTAVLQQSIAFVLGEQQADKQAELLAAQVITQGKQDGLITAQTSKTNTEDSLIDAQITKSAAEVTLLGIQGDKVEEERQLLEYKGVTEVAQTQDTANYLPVNGVIGKQKALYEAQKNGFARDAEQKLAKIMADSYAVRRSTLEDEVAPTGLYNTNINKVLEKAMTGINTAYDPTETPTT